MLLANGISIFLDNGKPVFSNGPRILPRNLLDGTTLESWAFDKFISADELFAKV